MSEAMTCAEAAKRSQRGEPVSFAGLTVVRNAKPTPVEVNMMMVDTVSGIGQRRVYEEADAAVIASALIGDDVAALQVVAVAAIRAFQRYQRADTANHHVGFVDGAVAWAMAADLERAVAAYLVHDPDLVAAERAFLDLEAGEQP